MGQKHKNSAMDIDRDKVKGIKLCLEELGRESEECGLRFSALIIRAAADSLAEFDAAKEEAGR